MFDYTLLDDIEIVLDLLNMEEEDLAKEIGVTPMTIARWKEDESKVTISNLNDFYNFAYKKRIRINQIKEQLFKEECPPNSTILFHGAKTSIEGNITLSKSKNKNDLGQAFYCGESLKQSAMFVSAYQESSLYILEFYKSNLNYVTLNVDRDWMLLIAYFRDRLSNYSNHPIILNLLSKLTNKDYIIAPIADNKMYEIIDSFIDGEITDVQCQHCLSATSLGNQYVFKTHKALSQIKILRHSFLSPLEKIHYLSSRQEESKINNDKVKIARKLYRGQGEYIEDILK